MWRFFAGAGSMALLMLAGFFVWRGMAQDEEPTIPPAPAASEARSYIRSEPPPTPPASDEKTREERRFDRADRNNDGLILLDELYQPRRKRFSNLDSNGDGRLSFEEWAVTTREKFEGADADRNRQLNRAEYATTAPKRRPKPKCSC